MGGATPSSLPVPRLGHASLASGSALRSVIGVGEHMFLAQSLSTKHRTKSLTHQTGNYPVTCFVSRPSGITFVKFHSSQVTIKTNLFD